MSTGAIHTVVILTGASRGLGAALARAAAAGGVHLVTVARHNDADVARAIAAAGGRHTGIAADLADDAGMAVAARAVAQVLADSPAAHVRLINNAGSVKPVDVAANLTDTAAIGRALALNVTAVIALTAAVLSALRETVIDCRVLNISSGAGRSPTPGWSVYCATKAAVDIATRVLNTEQRNGHSAATGDSTAAIDTPSSAVRIKAVALAPGVVDTDMQRTIRNQTAARFPALDRFQALHADGRLTAPDAVAARIYAYLNRDDFGSTEIDDIRNYD